MGRGIVLACVLVSALAGCGDRSSETDASASPASPAASPTALLPADGPVRAMATVLDDGRGPMLCLGGVMDSLPPQCSGPEVTGWVWEDHPEHDRASGVRWGEYTMVGAWDGTSFTPTDVRPTAPDDWPQEDVQALFATRCEEPGGGWVPTDPAEVDGDSLSAAHRVAEALPDYALSWGDRSINPGYTVLNVAVTEDEARAESAVREVWGGALCVTRFAHTQQRLREVARALRDLPGGLSSGYGSISNMVDITVVHDDGSIQAWADEEYGAGVVAVTSALTPVG